MNKRELRELTRINMNKLLQLKLKILAKLILKKYKPKVIGVTGSIGKTSTKEAVYAVLSFKFNARRNIKNYNNELGLPLTIIGTESGGRNLFKWFWIFCKAGKLILLRDKNYPQILVLEMAADRPKDLKYLLKIAKPYIGIVTSVGPVHLEYFGELKNIAKEKSRLVSAVNKDGWAILNADDAEVLKMKRNAAAKIITFGFSKKADICADHLRFSYKGDTESIGNLQGISFKVTYKGATVPVLLPRILGAGQVYASLAAIAAGALYGMNLVEISNALRKFKSPTGRMNIIKGVKKTLIIDDTYNSAPQSTLAALDVLIKIPLSSSCRRFAVLGDMLELGQISVESHQQVGRQAVKLKTDYLITVGERARDIARAAAGAGMSGDKIFSFAQSEEAGKFLENRIKKGDLILVKGSQGVRMEKIVKEIMAEPMKAGELLVRQGKKWK